ncbi:polysaccharide deacetylase family protein [Natronorubrum tibetense]|uniref:Polysaccharide deacetylase n=1 Tax=Natronorubrum tibetense GA33 TaxID=1114856 RepID=L9VKU0_9EURY|nr:polysaccharide deacetylase family protein [Natronorubrum tibetense]ELY37686.1 polysaccharide deacetylase [Natronorubrum tibetense GA33]
MSERDLACVTLDLENDWYFDADGYDHLTLEYIDDYIGVMRDLDVPVTVFAVGRTIERFPEVINRLDAELQSEFHLHSYQHDTSKSYDFREEIRQGKAAFENHFGVEPEGYRAPQGNIEPYEFEVLEEEGFRFDSSVFPSYRPGVYNNLGQPIEPYQPAQTDELLEVPIGVTTRTRIPTCQSYLKLLGRPYLRYLKRAALPAPLVVNTHLQDFYRTASHDRLDQPKRFIMKRNLDRSVDLFMRFVEQLRGRGYEFTQMSDIVVDHIDFAKLTYDESDETQTEPDTSVDEPGTDADTETEQVKIPEDRETTDG